MLVIGHRGASAAHPPGNTIAAFHAALELGADWVELDVRRTVDSRLAVHHDSHLPDGRPIHLTRSDDLPAWVPSLTDALTACEGLGVNIEIKNHPDDVDFDPTLDVVGAVLEVLVVLSPDRPVLLSAFHLPTVNRARELRPDLPTAHLVLEMSSSEILTAAASGHRAIHPWFGAVTREKVELAGSAGLSVNTWTVDDADEIRRLATLGVDGLVTNVPDLARTVLESIAEEEVEHDRIEDREHHPGHGDP